MREKTDLNTPWGQPLRLLPLLALFALSALFQAKGDFAGDGWRYIQNARNLLHGYLASPETLMFWNGPGYPLVLVPFIACKIPLVYARLANALFLYLGMAHFQGALRLAGMGKRSLGYAYAMGILLILHGALLGMIMTESLSAYLVCGAMYHFARACRGDGTRGRQRLHLAAAGLHLGYLALTKVFFGYALEAAIPIALGVWVYARLASRRWAGDQAASASASIRSRFDSAQENKRTARAAWIVCALGLAVCAPYLAHTWAKTGKANFWGNAGGMQRYFMTLPGKACFGDWMDYQAMLEHPEYFPDQVGFIRETVKLDYVSQDSVFKAAASRNCREHAGKCVSNWRANVNRMVFGFPNTFFPGVSPELSSGNRAFVYAFPFFLLLMLAVPGWLGRRSVPAWAHAALAFAGLSIGGMSLLSAIPRQVFPLLPMLGLWCALVAENAVQIRGRWRDAKAMG